MCGRGRQRGPRCCTTLVSVTQRFQTEVHYVPKSRIDYSFSNSALVEFSRLLDVFMRRGSCMQTRCIYAFRDEYCIVYIYTHTYMIYAFRDGGDE